MKNSRVMRDKKDWEPHDKKVSDSLQLLGLIASTNLKRIQLLFNNEMDWAIKMKANLEKSKQ